jgi:hypothetical protein
LVCCFLAHMLFICSFTFIYLYCSHSFGFGMCCFLTSTEFALATICLFLCCLDLCFLEEALLLVCFS